jgi:hypothetical protein
MPDDLWVHKGRRVFHRDSVERSYDPSDDHSASGFRRPPRAAGCVLDYFFALSFLGDGGHFATSEMKAMLDDPATFFAT